VWNKRKREREHSSSESIKPGCEGAVFARASAGGLIRRTRERGDRGEGKGVGERGERLWDEGDGGGES